MTPCAAAQAAPGKLVLTGPSGSVSVLFDERALKPDIEEIPIEDGRLKSAWGDRLYRILLRAGNPPLEGLWSLRIV